MFCFFHSLFSIIIMIMIIKITFIIIIMSLF